MSSYPLSPMPETVAARFEKGWPAYDIPSVWVEDVKRWTDELSKLDPDFTYKVIRAKSGSVKVWLSGNFENWSDSKPPKEVMSLELSRLLRTA